jgi:hypothetical protein
MKKYIRDSPMEDRFGNTVLRSAAQIILQGWHIEQLIVFL